MRAAIVLYKGEEAGVLRQLPDGSFLFRYNSEWVTNPFKPSISLTLPKHRIEFQSDRLFPFFYHMLAEGVNRETICRAHGLHPNDDFGVLLATAEGDTVGAVCIKQVEV